MPTEQSRARVLEPIVSVNRGADLWDIDPRITRVWSDGGRPDGAAQSTKPCGHPIYYGVEGREAAADSPVRIRVKHIVFFDDPAEAYAKLDRP